MTEHPHWDPMRYYDAVSRSGGTALEEMVRSADMLARYRRLAMNDALTAEDRAMVELEFGVRQYASTFAAFMADHPEQAANTIITALSNILGNAVGHAAALAGMRPEDALKPALERISQVAINSCQSPPPTEVN